MPEDTVAVVQHKSINLVYSVMSNTSLAAGVYCPQVDLGNASLDVCRQLAAGFILLTFLSEDAASHTDTNVLTLMACVKNGCSMFAQTFFFPCVSMGQMKEIVGGVTKVILVNKICNGVPKVIAEDSKPNGEAKGVNGW